MNYVDIIIIAILLFFVLKGTIKGFTREVMGVLSFIISFGVALHQMKNTANIINKYTNNYIVSLIIGYIAVFLIVFIILHIIAKAIHKLIKAISLGWLDRIGGAIFGLMFGVLFITLFVFLISFIPIKREIPPDRQNSRFFPFFEELAPKLFDLYFKIIPGSQALYEEIKSDILLEQLQKSGIDLGEVKKLFKFGSGEDKLPADSTKGNIDIKKQKEMTEKLTQEESYLKEPYQDLLKHLNIDTTKKKALQEIIQESRKKPENK